jgi:Fic family protein
LVRAGLIHYQFEAIHSFLGGNGRVGRLLAILLLIEWGLISQTLLKAVSSQSLDAITRIERLGQLRDAYRERLRTERAGTQPAVPGG